VRRAPEGRLPRAKAEPDGQRIAFAGGDAEDSLYVATADGSWLQRIIPYRDDPPAEASWICCIAWVSPEGNVDKTAPEILKVKPIHNSKDVSPQTNLYATFSEEMQAASITSKTFELYEKGSSTPPEASAAYNANTKTARLDPTDDLKPATSAGFCAS
jgi:hypothetical protein